MASFPTLSVHLVSTISFLGTVYARTTLEGCTFTETVSESDGYSIVWYVPETGEICDVPVCGGGLNPFDYDNPACSEYTGTAPYKPSYLEDYGPCPTTVTAETAVDAAVTSAAGWTEGEEGEVDHEVNPGDDESRSTTITSTRFSSTVPTSSTEKARSTSTPIIPSSRASLRPSPTSTSSAACVQFNFPDRLFTGLVASNAAAEPMADHRPYGSTFANHLFLGSVSDAVAGTSATSTSTTGTFTTSNPKTSTPKNGTPKNGTPKSGTPESGTPESGTPESGTPESGTPESGTPEIGTSRIGTSTTSTSTTSTSATGTSATSTSNNQLYQYRSWWVDYHDRRSNDLGGPGPCNE
ncbi:hypothetical protein BDV11DRAFT_215736 [Aspergillus similis]